MANLATKAPNFTKENARAFAMKGAATRKANREREKLLLAQAAELARLNPKPTDDQARKETTLIQIDKLDQLINRALERKDDDLFLRLATAKEKLWKLVQPTAGVMKPSRISKRTIEPTAKPEDASETV